MVKYKIEELSIYNGEKSFVCHINSKKEYTKLKEMFKNINNYDSRYNYYLLASPGISKNPYYNTIEFSQIDFQENLVECIEIW